MHPAAPSSVAGVLQTDNRAGWVRVLVDSILRQPFSDFEAIVGDDGSADGTLGGSVRRTPADQRFR